MSVLSQIFLMFKSDSAPPPAPGINFILNNPGSYTPPAGNDINLILNDPYTPPTPLPPSSGMTLVYNTALSPTTEIELPLDGTVNVVVNWGDGNIESFTTAGNKSHTYATNGTYTVSITGSLEHFGYQSESPSQINPQSLVGVTSWGNLGLTNLRGAFSHCENLTQVPTNLPSTVTNLSFTFQFCLIFNQDISTWDISNVTTLEGTFLRADLFNQPLNTWNTSNVTTMEMLFLDAYEFNQPLNNWNVSNVTNMRDTFGSAYKFNQNINNWNVSSVTNMRGMFAYAYEFNQPLNNWDVSSVTINSGFSGMGLMFWNALAFNQNISNWCVTLLPSEPEYFSTGSPLTAPNKPVWGTCPSEAPVAQFTADVTSGTAPLTVNFTDTSTNSPTSWAWDFQNNGSTDSIIQNPSHIYNVAGTYSVKLTASNINGSDNEIKSNYITVSEAPFNPPYSSTVALFNFQGADNSTTFTDNAANPLGSYSIIGSPVISTFEYVGKLQGSTTYGNSSMYVGSGSPSAKNIIQLTSGDITVGSGTNWSIEGWFKTSETGSIAPTLSGLKILTDSSNPHIIKGLGFFNSSSIIKYIWGSTDMSGTVYFDNTFGPGTSSNTLWFYYCLISNSVTNTLSLFVATDATNISASSTYTPSNGQPPILRFSSIGGSSDVSSQAFYGFIGPTRITVGNSGTPASKPLGLYPTS